MKIAGINKNSFVDMKGMIAYVVFTRGCNLNCWYCHNRELIGDTADLLDEETVMDDIIERKEFIDIAVITGGEPTLQDDLRDFIILLKRENIKVKLDTNSTNPDVIEDLLSLNLLDYIAMDIKAPLHKYSKVVCTLIDVNNIRRSIDLIRHSGIDYEFRTTFSPDLTGDDILEIAKSIEGSNLYVLQQFVKHDNMLKKSFGPHSDEYILKTAEEAGKYVNTTVKGLGII